MCVGFLIVIIWGIGDEFWINYFVGCSLFELGGGFNVGVILTYC